MVSFDSVRRLPGGEQGGLGSVDSHLSCSDTDVAVDSSASGASKGTHADMAEL